jgi:hypothetical protein
MLDSLISTICLTIVLHCQSIYRKHMNIHNCLLLISIASLSPFLAACSTARGTTKQDPPKDYVQIEPRSYNPETRSFDRPWPFGPEADAQ